MYLFPLCMLPGLEIVEQTRVEMLNDDDCGQAVATRATATGLLASTMRDTSHLVPEILLLHIVSPDKVFSFWAFCFELQWLVV